MRTLVISNMYPPHHHGGYELSCRDVVDRWRAAGHEVTVLTTTMRVEGVTEPDPPHVRRELGMYWEDHVLTSPPIWQRFQQERANQRVLARALDDVRPDVVSVWNMGALSLGLLTALSRRAVAVVYVVCDDWMLYEEQLDAWTRLFTHRRGAARVVEAVTGVPTLVGDLGVSGRFVFVSDTTRQRAARRWTIPNSVVIHSGIDLEDFPLTSPRDTAWEWHLLYVGRIDARKGIATVVSALPQLPSAATLAIIGSGEEAHRQELVAMANELGVADRVSFSVVPRSALRERYAAADVVVFPSVWEEPFGLVPIEAMACATPVVATGVGGSGEFLNDGVNALLYPAGSVPELVAALSRLAASAELRRTLVAGGLLTAEAMNTETYAAALLAVHLSEIQRPSA